MKNAQKLQAFILLILAIVATFFGGKAIMTQEASGFIIGSARSAGIYYGKDAIVIGIIMLVAAGVLFWLAYKSAQGVE
jgi:hypothetical protein